MADRPYLVDPVDKPMSTFIVNICYVYTVCITLIKRQAEVHMNRTQVYTILVLSTQQYTTNNLQIKNPKKNTIHPIIAAVNALSNSLLIKKL